jgi:hypothetical protein
MTEAEGTIKVRADHTSHARTCAADGVRGRAWFRPPRRADAFARAKPAARLPVIRDAEIEQLLRDYTQPILRAAGLRPAERSGHHHQRPLVQTPS